MEATRQELESVQETAQGATEGRPPEDAPAPAAAENAPAAAEAAPERQEQPRRDAAGSREAPGPASAVVVSGPRTGPRPERPSLWKRIAMRRNVRRAQQLAESDALEPVREGLASLEERMSALERTIATGAERLEERLTQFWEIEEQLGQLQERLRELRKGQQETAERTRLLVRQVTLLAVLVVAATAAGGAALLGLIP